MQKLIIETPDGRGEAIKLDRDEPWHVALPFAEFDFYGSVPQVRAEINKILKRETNQTKPNQRKQNNEL